MCLAILKPAKVVISEETLRNGWIGNSDGAGYAFAHGGKLVTRKGFEKLTDFLEAINKDFKKYKNSPFAIHFRIRSMGEKSPENTHPFSIAGDVGALIHNGTLDGSGANWNQGPSDTSIFSKEFGDLLTYEFVKTNKEAINTAIGNSNKMALLYADGSYHILNETHGHWKDDAWYSNRSYTPRPQTVYPGMRDYEYGANGYE